MNRGEVFEIIFRERRTANIFIILAIRKGITFKLKDIDQHGIEMLDQLYAEGLLGGE